MRPGRVLVLVGVHQFNHFNFQVDNIFYYVQKSTLLHVYKIVIFVEFFNHNMDTILIIILVMFCILFILGW